VKSGVALAASLAVAPFVALSPAPAVAKDVDPEVRIQQLDRVYLRMSGNSRKLRKLSKCLIEQDEAAARGAFGYDNWTEQQREVLGGVYSKGSRCLMVVALELRTSGVMALGAIADGLLDIDGINPPVRKLPSAVTFGDGDFTWDIARPSQDFQFEHVPVANCLVNRHSGKIAELLATGQTSDKERKVFNSLTAELKDCSPTGKLQKLHPVVLRAVLAAGYYSASRNVAQNDNDGGGD